MPTTSTSRAPHVRPYRSADRAAVRAVCCDTGLAGAPVDPLFPDRDAFADFFTRYYTDWEPETSWVAEVDGRVVGYLIGCTRPRRFALVQPALVLLATVPKVASRLLAGRYGPAARRFLRWFLVRSWRETPRRPSGPAAHFHFNLLPGHRNTGAALRLWQAFDRALEERGIQRVYGQIRTGGGEEGWRGERLFARWGFRCLDRRRVSKFEGLDREAEAAGPNGAEPSGAAQAGTRSARPGPAGAGPAGAGPNEPGPNEPGPNGPEPDGPKSSGPQSSGPQSSGPEAERRRGAPTGEVWVSTLVREGRRGALTVPGPVRGGA